MIGISRSLAVIVGIGALVQAGDAAASGFMIRENSAEGLATAFAGGASRADEPATVFNNPAGMSFLDGDQTQIGGTAVLPGIHFTGSASVQPGNIPVPGDNSRQDGQIALVPHAYGTYAINDKWRFGIAITVPFGNTLDYSENWSGRYVNLKTGVLTADINPNLSYKITDRVAIAAGFSAQYFKGELAGAIPQFVAFYPNPAPDAYYRFKADGWGWGYNVGLLAEPFDGTRLGLTYRSRVNHGISGNLGFSPSTSPLLGLISGPARTEVDLPASITGSITQQITPDFSLSSDVQFTNWSVFKKVAVISANPTFTFDEEYQDSWMVSVGGVYRFSNMWTFRAGVGWDETPVRDAFRDVGVPDKDRYMVGAGFSYQITDSVGVDFGYAHYFAAHATMNESANRIDPFTGAVFLQGTYNNHLDWVSISLRTKL
jgi:long-chain fatty acid transport protein